MDDRVAYWAPMKPPGEAVVAPRRGAVVWHEIAKGLSTEDAALGLGASQAAGSRWFRERGGMATFMREPLLGRCLSFEEREEIALLRAQGVVYRQLARRFGRSTISMELRRNGHPCWQARVPGVGCKVEGRADGLSS